MMNGRKLSSLLLSLLLFDFANANCGNLNLTGRFGVVNYDSEASIEACTWTFNPPRNETNVFILQFFRFYYHVNAIVVLPGNGQGSFLIENPEDNFCRIYQRSPGYIVTSQTSNCPVSIINDSSWPPQLTVVNGRTQNGIDGLYFGLTYVFNENSKEMTRRDTKQRQITTNTVTMETAIRKELNCTAAIAAAVSLAVLLVIGGFIMTGLLIKQRSLKAKTSTRVAEPSTTSPTNEEPSYSTIAKKEMVQNILYHAYDDQLE